jgi:hypothetical protein
MVQDIWQLLNGYSVVAVAVSAIVIGVLALLVKNWRLLGQWIAVKKAASHQGVLWSLAQEAYAQAELAGVEFLTSDKLDFAIDYALKKAARLKIPVESKEEIKAKIQEAWIKLDKIPNQQSSSSNVTINTGLPELSEDQATKLVETIAAQREANASSGDTLK